MLEDEFASDLEVIAASESVAARSQSLVDGAHDGGGEGVLHVLRGLVAEAEGAGHAEAGVELFGRVGVDGVGAFGFADVHGDEVRLAAADDDDFGGGVEGGESGGREGGGERTEVFLAVLERAGISVSNVELLGFDIIVLESYAAEEVADEDYEGPRSSVLV